MYSLTQYMLNVLLDLNIRKRFQCLKLNLKTLIRSAPQFSKLLQAFRPIIWDGEKNPSTETVFGGYN